jgi:hypothetical protein
MNGRNDTMTHMQQREEEIEKATQFFRGSAPPGAGSVVLQFWKKWIKVYALKKQDY